MSPCDEQLLGAYHDGELDAAGRERFEKHLAECSACSAELARLREASKLFGDYPFQDITENELSALHRAIDQSDDFQVWRIGGTLGLIAASILVVSFAWLRTIPASTAKPGQQAPMVAQKPVPAWERVAVQLRPDPMVEEQDDLARVDMMLEGLGQQGAQR